MNVSPEEIITVALAKTFRNGEVGFTGLATGGAAALYITGIPLAAMAFAQHTHAPDLTILLAGWCINPDLSAMKALPTAEFDRALQDLPCEAQMQTYPGHYAVRRGDVDFGFGSGVQVDQQGNINSTCIGDYQHPDVRLVGSILLPEHLTCFGREYLMMPHHQPRSFVEQVDYVSGVGYPDGLAGRQALGLEHGGPAWIVTPKCIFDFSRPSGRVRLASIHPGIDPEEIIQATGFSVDVNDVPVTPLPEKEELAILRRCVDPHGVLLPRRHSLQLT
ncbi:CoA-transferase subunit beta [Pantoea sp. BAV 3049]|uniref:CoA-transferase subunit beta n=1 Tax=Pantoea sp. BAV 3049 TaxID=2654188 RepID=UPI00131D1D3E|nr:CoA-transferase [Pantoea sp. BAV 3049]